MHVPETELTPLQRLLFAYAPAKHRAVYGAIFALDNRCAAILRGTNEVMLGQMRLAWWRDAIGKPATDRPQGDPVLGALSGMEKQGLDLDALVPVINAWELLLVNEELTHEQLGDYAAQRGGTIFSVLNRHIVNEACVEQISQVGSFWALWDLARHSIDDGMRRGLMDRLQTEQAANAGLKLPRSLRPLSILKKLADRDLRKGSVDEPIMRPATAAQIIWHGVTGL
ncbi:squalene/phytoene synthase family protein [Sphingorhabdus sp. Alg239-R122]|uniref:squalene/phytoene synthase family protein n=1 Tax=Sphingorhabdus sp. Alg239-R122 TaxID=2305989 RepID=UPI0013DA7DF7|nr:squalene/phytoene synthase family protein [Sphingorhabdus sp. Alg239-R122]